MAVYLGLDPGVSGGIAAVSTCSAVTEAHKMPDTDQGIFTLIRSVYAVEAQVFAVLERARTSPQMGVVSAGTFMGNYRALRMALTALAIPFEEVTPQRWQAFMGCMSGGDKNVTKLRAQSLFPGVRVTHATADALLIAEYARRVHMTLDSFTPATKGSTHGQTTKSPRRARASARA